LWLHRNHLQIAAAELLLTGSEGAELEDEPALFVELLDATVVAVGDPEVAVGVDA
jgi:hypothetical protein